MEKNKCLSITHYLSISDSKYIPQDVGSVQAELSNAKNFLFLQIAYLSNVENPYQKGIKHLNYRCK